MARREAAKKSRKQATRRSSTPNNETEEQEDPRKDQKAKAGRNLSLVNSEAVQARSTKTKGGEESDRPQGPPFPLQILESRKQNTKTIFQTGGQEKEIGKGENNNFQSTQVVATPEAEVKGNPGC